MNRKTKIATAIVGLATAATPLGKISYGADDPASRFDAFHSRWSNVSTSLADSLAESGYPDAGSRRWEDCVIRAGRVHITIVCPDGWTTRFADYADEVGQFDNPTSR